MTVLLVYFDGKDGHIERRRMLEGPIPSPFGSEFETKKTNDVTSVYNEMTGSCILGVNIVQERPS